MRDLRAHFEACFTPPLEAQGTRITFYFSVKTNGTIVGRPRLIWMGAKAEGDARSRLLAGFRDQFTQCLPLHMTRDLAALIPGKVYFLQFNVGDAGQPSEVLLRPFGSMGDPLVDVPEAW